MLYICITICLGTTNSQLRQLCSKISIPYSIVSGLHTSLLLVCKRHCLLPTGRLYLGCRRKCSRPSLLNLIRLSRSLPQFVMAKGNNVGKVTKRDNLVTLLLSHWLPHRRAAAPPQLHKSWRPRIDPLLGCGTSLTLCSRYGRSNNIVRAKG